MTTHVLSTETNEELGELPAPMNVSRVKVRNFRLLRNVDINLDDRTTVLVGRNNSGKTTFAEVFTRFMQPSVLNFTVADFSAESYPEFRQAWTTYQTGDVEEARQLLPEISLTLEIEYSKDLLNYGPLAAAVVDLDPDCTTAVIRFSYSLEDGRLPEFFEGLETNENTSDEYVMSIVGERIQKMFTRSITAIDPGDSSNTREISQQDIRGLLTVHFLKAQRGLDDEKERPKDLIGRIFQTLFDAASKADDGSSQKNTANALTEAVAGVEENLDEKVGVMVDDLIPTLQSFGYPGLADPGLKAKITLDIERVLTNYTSIHYDGVAGVTLPESYSGLGSRNLILILLTLLSYYREYTARGNMPGLHLIFIEEPEAHLHPQMQEVFIDQLSSVAKLFPKLDNNRLPWWPQFAVSTHSSHVANRANFSAIRYFRVTDNHRDKNGRHSEVLDLAVAEDLDKEFLHQYLTLTRSDLFFADKAILVEGTSERLIIPAAIKNINHKLSSQYVTLLEVGGAYAHIFFPLLDFLGIPTLVITDLDAVGPDKGKTQLSSTEVHKGTTTSNATIKTWFPAKDDQKLSALLEAAKTTEAIIKGNRYLAYQIPDNASGACGRTFEDAFILANPSAVKIELTHDIDEDEAKARDAAKAMKKSEFALRFAVKDSNWVTPRYIQRGLDWLLDYSPVDEDTEELTSDMGVAVR